MKKLILTASLVMPASLSSAAFGQTVNYSDLQELFGEPVTTSATGKPQRSSEAPASMVIITADEVRRSGATTLPEVLQNYAGIDVNTYTTAQADMTIRGANIALTPRLLVLVNGRQVYLDHFGYTDWNLLGVEMSEIQQVEVVRGPNSALFGFNAVSGVVNIITKDPITHPKVNASVQYGNKGQVIGSVSLRQKLSDKVGVRLSGGYREEDEWSGIAQPQTSFVVSDQPAKSYNAAGELTWQLASNIRASADYTYARSKQAEQGFLNRVIQSDTELKGINGVVAVDSSLGLVKAQVYYNDLTHNYVSAGLPFSMSDTVFVAKLDDLIKVNANNSVRVGVEYRNNQFEFLNGTSALTEYDVLSGNAMWEWRITDKLVATNALRVDHMNLKYTAPADPTFFYNVEDYDRKFTEWSYNSSLMYEIDPRTRVRFSAARGIHIPSSRSFGLYTIPIGPSRLGFEPAEDTAPGSDVSYELAFNRTVDAINGQASLVFTANKSSQFQAYGINSGSRAHVGGNGVVDTQLGDFKTYTVEASANGKFSDALGWMLNYTYTDVNETFVTERLEDIVPMDDGTAKHKINAVLNYHENAWEGYVAARYRSATMQNPAPFNVATAADLVSLPGNLTLDARVAYALNNTWTVSVAGQNLTGNNSAGLNAFDAADTRVRVGLSAQF